MPKKPIKPDPARPTQNRVWIELEKPFDTAHADEICKQANNMLQRLNPDTNYTFFWSAEKGMYCYGYVSFTYLAERGTWLNLSFLGRPLDQTAEDWEKSRV